MNTGANGAYSVTGFTQGEASMSNEDTTALYRKSDTDQDLQDSSLQEVWIVMYPGSLFDVFSTADAAHNVHLRIKGSRVIYRRVIQPRG